MAQARTRTLAESEARIGGGPRVRGRVTGEGNVVVLGHVEGEITVRGDLTIEQGGSVTSDVDAHSVTISGSLDGDVSASGVVAIHAGARVRGDLRGSEITLDEGAEFAGRLDSEFALPPELEGTSARR
jgi:cytoskeletal protein CcmA (bactofilin family)